MALVTLQPKLSTIFHSSPYPFDTNHYISGKKRPPSCLYRMT